MINRKIFISLILTVVLFIALVFIEKKLLNVEAKKQIVYAKVNISRGDKLSEDMFKMKDEDMTDINKDMVFTLNDIENYYAKENIYAGEGLNKNRITEEEVLKYDLLKDERLISISFDKIDKAVAGILRKGDLIDIILTRKSNVSNTEIKITETLEQKIRVIGAKNSSGEFIEEDINANAAYLLLAVNPIQEHLIYDNMEDGTIRVSKVPEGSEKHNKIIIKNGEIQKEGVQ